jgi:hypothetical protein
VSRKNIVQKFDMLKGVSAASPQTSVKTNVEQLDSASIHVKFSSVVSGTLTVEARNGSYPEHDDSNWYPLSFGSALTITSETDVQILLKEMPFSEIRLKWVPSAATGIVNAFLTMKTYGA